MPRRWIAEARPDSLQAQLARGRKLGCSRPLQVRTCQRATELSSLIDYGVRQYAWEASSESVMLWGRARRAFTFP